MFVATLRLVLSARRETRERTERAIASAAKSDRLIAVSDRLAVQSFDDIAESRARLERLIFIG